MRAAREDDIRSAGRTGLALRTYIVGLVALFVVVAVSTILYSRAQSIAATRARAASDADFGAQLAGDAIRTALDDAVRVVTTTAATPTITQAFGAPAGACNLQFGGVGPFPTGHLDVVGPDGRVGCSSLQERFEVDYAETPWFGQATTAPGIIGPVVDARTGKQVMVVAAPIPGGGAVLGFLDLDNLGPGLAKNYGGPVGLEFVVTAGPSVLARSIDPQRWTNVPHEGSGFDPSAGEGPDLDGLDRLYGRRPVADTDWVVHAGVDHAARIAGANDRAVRTLVATGAGLALLLAAALFMHRRIAQPIRRLSHAVRDATDHRAATAVEVTGPREVRSLSEDFRTLLASAERELALASRLAAIVESSPDAIVSATPDGMITTWNPGAERTFGISADDAIGTRFDALVPADRIDEHRATTRRAAGGEPVEAFETRRLRADGCPIDVSLALAPLLGPSGTVIGLSAVARDITAQKRLDAERASLDRRLVQTERLESLGQLAGGIAHDFNNLLSVIINYAQLAMEELPETSPMRQDIAEIRNAGESAARLTRQLLLFGKREGSAAEPIDLDAVVSDVHNLLARSIGEHVDLQVFLDGSLPRVLIDRGQVEQILLNLAINARDAMPGGGRLSIATRTVQLDEEYCRLHPGASPGTHVELAVSDTGTGMSDEVIAHAFEPFFTTKAVGEGTGLGLATIYGIVTSAGGTVAIYSEPGIGTTFRVQLPAADQPAPADGDDPAPVPHGDGETIVVVEDEPAVMELTTRLLRRNGYTVIPATTTDEAHAAVTANPTVRLLLTDSVMPEMSGQALANRVHGVRPDLPVLFMSGYSHGVLGPQPGGAGESGFIQKPFTERTLLTGVADALAGKPPPERVPRTAR